VEVHPDNVFDLRLDCPWPELVQYADEFNLSAMSSMELSHTPYIILLLKARQMWRDRNGDKAPSSSQDREAFKQLIRSIGGGEAEENVMEACSQAFRTFQRTTVPSSINRLFEDESCKQIGVKSDAFWLLVCALRRYCESTDGQGRLPLLGRLPDMKADTERYVRLQQMYAQAQFLQPFIILTNEIAITTRQEMIGAYSWRICVV
jgi:amyloid beta precursor protein binding protein 1